jgi:hypothetical protein
MMFFKFFIIRSNQKKEKIYSEKEITANKWTHVAITFTFDGNLTDLSLFINGNQDSEVQLNLFEMIILDFNF